jgi:hypothetical protein
MLYFELAWNLCAKVVDAYTETGGVDGSGVGWVRWGKSQTSQATVGSGVWVSTIGTICTKSVGTKSIGTISSKTGIAVSGITMVSVIEISWISISFSFTFADEVAVVASESIGTESVSTIGTKTSISKSSMMIS